LLDEINSERQNIVVDKRLINKCLETAMICIDKGYQSNNERAIYMINYA